MSKSPFTCRCGRVLAYQRRSGNVAVLAGVHVEARLGEGRAMLTCPDCKQERWMREGVIVRWGEADENDNQLIAS